MMNRRVVLILSGLALVTALPLIPVVVVQGEAGLTANPLGWRLTVFAVLAGALLVYPAAIFCGLRIGGKLGLAAPLTEAWVTGRAPEDLTGRLVAGLALGFGFGLAGVLIAANLGGATGEADAAGADIIPLWTGVAQAVSAGVGEEVLFRFGLMSLIAWFAWEGSARPRWGPQRLRHVVRRRPGGPGLRIGSWGFGPGRHAGGASARRGGFRLALLAPRIGGRHRRPFHLRYGAVLRHRAGSIGDENHGRDD